MTNPKIITFFKTNNVSDRGHEMTVTEVATRFWTSDAAQEWAALVKANKSVIPMERLALSWVPDNLGDWECRDDWGPIFNAIFDARPWKDTA